MARQSPSASTGPRASFHERADRYRTPPRQRRSTTQRAAPNTFLQPSHDTSDSQHRSGNSFLSCSVNRDVNTVPSIRISSMSQVNSNLSILNSEFASQLSNNVQLTHVASSISSEEFHTPRSGSTDTDEMRGATTRGERDWTPPPKREVEERMLRAPTKTGNSSELEKAILRNDVTLVINALRDDHPNAPLSQRAGYLTSLQFARHIGSNEAVCSALMRAGGQ